MNRQEKQEFVDEFSQRMAKAKLVVVADYTGLNVEAMNRLRRSLGPRSTAQLTVVKNTLCFRAMQSTSMSRMEKHLVGPTAAILSFQDPVAQAKALTDFSKENAKFKIKAGFFDGRVIEESDVKALASMPPREVLLAQLLGTLQAPMSNFVGVLAAVPQQFIGVLTAYKEKQEQQSASSA